MYINIIINKFYKINSANKNLKYSIIFFNIEYPHIDPTSTKNIKKYEYE